MSATAPASPPSVRNSYAPEQPSTIPHRSQSQSLAHRPSSTGGPPHRSTSHAGSGRPPSSSRAATNLANVARRDFEQTNVARPPSQTRRSSSHDRQGSEDRYAPNAEASKPPTHRASSRSTQHSRLNSEAPSAQGSTAGANGASAEDGTRTASSSAPRKRTTITTSTGTWALGKTIGAGSMGKVKLAKNMETGEQVAVKIVPRHSTDDHRTQQERERADQSKEIRTAREAAITSLVNHPYVCGMRDVVRTNFHWYMLFEYVNGGQMLDYIISHGRLKEKPARKFARQIASALDYCHKNSIVHRDLKIENILISKSGDIKIIDFGLSNLFSPRSQLKTFCGSLYFAAPELLQARQYQGPEVDVWSFGIVLYVLVCGKVPFDDQSMPQLHAKIKKGYVEYPPWLTNECRSIISRMLVTDPKNRATLSEIMNHPWMIRGFPGPPENYLPHREPLQLPLDEEVLSKMQGFDFGNAEFIKSQLEKCLESDEYQRAVQLAAKKHQAHQADHERKKSGVFDFYQRRKSASSKDLLSNASNEAVNFGDDPVYGFSPLISIYYLAREKHEQEKAESNPGALALPQSPGEKPLQLPDLPAPAAAHTNAATFEMAGEAPTGGRSRPRARTHGEEELGASAQNARAQVTPAPAISQQHSERLVSKKDGPVGGLLRRFSTRRGKDTDRSRSPQPISSVAASGAADPPSSLRKTISTRRSRDADAPPPSAPPSAYQGSASKEPGLLAPPATNEPTSRRRGLGRSTSVNSGDLRRRFSRRGASESHAPPRTTAGSESERSSLAEPKSGNAEGQEEYESSGMRFGTTTGRTRSVGHSNRDSMQVRRVRRDINREYDVPEETDQELAAESRRKSRSGVSSEVLKPIYLKGLFSVSTTSSKPLAFIRSDIIRVLDQLGVEFQERKGGFDCRHQPSIDLHKVVDNPSEKPPLSHRRRISFAGLRGGDRDRDETTAPATPRSTSRKQTQNDSNYNTNSEDSDDENAGHRREPTHQRAAGETTTQVQSDLGQSMILRFEILVVKVPLLSLHGLQFKKVDGGTWQYKKMAETILGELRL